MSSQRTPAESRTARPGRDRPLRGLQGGYDITGWPITVPARPGEMAESWLVRIASRYGLTPGAVLRSAGATSQNSWPANGRDDLLATVAARVRAPAHPAVRERTDAPVAAWLTRYGRAGAARQGAWFCPPCLREPAPFWRAEWTGRLNLICVRHHVLLVSKCPVCGQRPFTSTSWTHRAAPLWSCPARADRPGRAHRSHRDWCDFDLRSAPTLTATTADVVASDYLRAALEAAADRPNAPVSLPIGDWEVSATERADALLELLDEQVRAPRWDVVGPRRVLDAVAVAVDVLTATSPTAVAGVATTGRVLDPAGDHTPLHPGRRHRHPRNPVLMSLLLASVAGDLSLGDRLMYRTASARPRPPVRVEVRVGSERRAEGTWPARGWVPPMLWQEVLTQHVTGRSPYARAALSLALSKVGSSVPLRAIAVDLGLPGWLADRIRHVLRRRTRADLAALTADLERLFTTLEACPPPIDYSARVATGRDLARLHSAAVDAAALQGLVLHEPDEAGLTAMLWATYTGSNPRLCPVLDAGTAPPRWLPGLDVEDFLTTAFQQLPHYAGEPLAWRPP